MRPDNRISAMWIRDATFLKYGRRTGPELISGYLLAWHQKSPWHRCAQLVLFVAVAVAVAVAAQGIEVRVVEVSIGPSISSTAPAWLLVSDSAPVQECEKSGAYFMCTLIHMWCLRQDAREMCAATCRQTTHIFFSTYLYGAQHTCCWVLTGQRSQRGWGWWPVIDVVQYMAIWPPINMHYGHLLWFNYFGQHIGGGSGQD